MGEKKFKCDKCNKGYTKNQALKQHIASAHFGKTHTCPECGLKIKDQSNLRKHILRIHNKDRKSSKSPEKKKQRLKLLDNIEGLPEIEPCLGFNLEEMINDGYSNEAAQCLANSWEFVRTGYKGGKLKCEYNIRLKQEHVDVDLLKTYLMQIHKIQPNAYRINIAWGSLMQHIETGEWKYFHTSNPASRYWKEPITIRSEEDLLKALEYIDAQDIVDHISLKRDNTKFVVKRIVNFNVVVFPMQGHTLLGNTISLPPHIIKHQFIKPLIKDSHQNEYKNTNCCFRCISYHLNGNSEMGLKKNAMRLSDQFRKFIDVPLGKFNGKITLDQLLQVELCFGLRISVYSLIPKVNDDNELDEEKNATEFYNESNLNRFEATLVRGSSTKISEAKNGELFLDLTMDHFSVITSIENYACSFSCNTCKKLFKTRWDCTRHQKRCFRDDNKQRAVHIAGAYKMPENIFYQLEQTGFKLNENDKFCEYFTAFDFETVNAILKDDDPRRRLGQKLVFSRILELGSCSIISSVAGFQKPHFIKRKTSESEFMNRVVDYLCAIAERSQEVQREKLAHVFEQINEKIESINKSIKESSDIEVEEYNKYLLKKHTRLQTELEKYVKSHVIYAFNGSRFDLKVARSYLLEQLLNRKIKVTSVIKRQSAYVLLATPTLVFKDMASLLAPGTSLQSFFQAFDLPVSKWAFPYGYITNLSKLDETELPAYSEFWSSLKGKYLVSEEGYKEIAEWYKLNAKCLWDYLEEYNNRDVISMIPGLELLRQFWKCYGICMVQSGISLSSLSARLMHKSVPKNSPFIWLPGKHESYVHDLASESVVGGPALIWTRYGEKDKTYIRNGPNICKSILGIDANALYLSALAKDMPTSYAVAWQLDKKGQNFYRKVLIPPWISVGEIEYCCWIQYMTDDPNLRHAYNYGQATFGKKKFRPDACSYRDNTLYHYFGCFWHFCTKCSVGQKRRIQNPKKAAEREKEDQKMLDYFDKLGFDQKLMTECQWNKSKKCDHSIQTFLEHKINMPLANVRKMSKNEILEKIRVGELFGLARVSLHVPQDKYDKFKEFCPIFKTRVVTREDLSEFQLKIAQDGDFLKHGRRTLISVMKAEKIVLTTPLLQWYMNNGLVIEDVFDVVQFKPAKLFEKFAENVTHHRMLADKDPSKKQLGVMHKNAGNGAYGYAKLRLLEMYYEFLDYFFDRSTWELNCADTDSFYMSLSEESLEGFQKLVPQDKLAEYKITREKFLVTNECDLRKPGLFKVEYEGTGIVCLTPKVYCVWNDEKETTKMSCKGINQRQMLEKDKYLEVLNCQKDIELENAGFRFQHGRMYQYNQKKRGLLYFFIKRKLNPDGITTEPHVS